MRVTVHYLAQLKRLVGMASEVFDLPPGSRVADLLTTVARQHGDAARTLVLAADAQPQPSLLLFVNDAQVAASRLLDEGDVVTLLTPMAGG